MTQEVTTATPPPISNPEPLDEQQSIERFFAVIGEVVGVDRVPPNEHFLDIGGDSLSMAIIIDWIGQEFATEPEVDWFFESQDLQDLAQRWWAKVKAS